ncbi:PREDICTED: ubiquitin-like domain-containing CTD phosphatase 1 [Lupinus angustifolius]|uniref:ubiquitin-like domain-containing CTD phosphatase 1 n=1 Tax=Lupinus angustifolius TaxID=3871 RepID=UPI00092E573D|nr:PREDICTED: ubiquitin-like domain-containing CTD phosphatase 1 [Lupinus angustifolius]
MEPHATQSKSIDCSISEKVIKDTMNNESTIADKGKNDRECLSYTDETMTVSGIAINEERMSKIMRISLTGTKVGCLKNKLIVLDINGLLADIVCPAPKDHKADAMIARRAIFKRPYYFEFLNFCFENFEVGLWSSRKMENVKRIVDFLMGEMKNKLLFCWDVSHCTETSFRTLENRHKDLVFKDLRKIWDKHDPNLPWEKGYYNESNTLLLDDSPYKALLNPPHTSVFPHTFSYQNRSDNSLAPGGNLREYLDGLAKAENMSKYVEEHPFGQEGIDETSQSWSFYDQVIRSLLTCRSEDNASVKVNISVQNILPATE